MLRKSFLLLLLFVSYISISLADEGMWLPMLVERLNHVDMKKMGLQLTPEEIYSVNNSSLKDGIAQLTITGGGYCTSEMVSNEGLMLSNHHCGYGAIQAQSTVENDYLKNGFWATSKVEELKCDKMHATFLIRVEDVSQKVLSQLNATMTEAEREAKLAEIFAKLEAEATQGTTYTAKVNSFFEGNEFYLFVLQTYKDVRLVGAPPTALGAYGDDTDNWMWPRHVADFCIFRVYMNQKNEPADYNKKNIPYKPKYFLPISIKGVKKDDFAMVFGYPGTTDRFMTSYGVSMIVEQTNLAIVTIRNAKLDIIKNYMKTSQDANIKYATKYQQSDNYRKYYQGQMDVLKRLNVIDKKRDLEKQFQQWLDKNPSAKQKYGTALPEISTAYEEIRKYNLAKYYYKEAIERGPEIFTYAKEFVDLYNEMKATKPDVDKVTTLATKLKYNATKYFKDYDPETDKSVFSSLLKLYFSNIPKDQLPDIFTLIEKKYKNNFGDFTQDVFSKSIFASKDKVIEFLADPTYKTIEKDVAYKAMQSFADKNKQILELMKTPNYKLAHGNRLFVAGLKEMQKDKKFYPNANRTMRLTYGKVTDYTPPGGKPTNYFTTFDEMVAKEDTKREDLTLPPKMKELYKNKDFGKYADNGVMKVDFLTNHDVTGGVSGAPVLNGKGQLVGLVFDINWEATSVAIAFDPQLQRSICMDVRFMLFVIDKYAGASNILKELTIVEN